MEHQELIEVLSERTNYSKREIRYILRELAYVIGDALKDGRDVCINNLGRFKNTRNRGGIQYSEVHGRYINLIETRRVSFKSSQHLKRQVKLSTDLFRKQPIEVRFGLPKKREQDGKVRRTNRSRKSTKRKEGRSRG